MQFTLRPDNVRERVALWLNRSPVPLVQALFGMMGSRVSMAGVRLGVYAALAERPYGAVELAERVGASADGVRLLLDSLCALHMVRRRGETYVLAPRARRWLDPRSAQYVGDFLEFNYAQWEWWSSLEDAIRTGRGPAIHDYPPDDPRWDLYARAMFQLARVVSPEIVRQIRLHPGAESLLDLGGAHGWFSASLCERHPSLRSLVVDLPGAARAGRRIAEREGYADRVRHLEGDVRSADLGRGRDGVLLFQLMHHLTPDENRNLLAGISNALKPGALVAVLELFAPEGRAEADASTLIGLHYFLTSSASAYTWPQVDGWLRESGFRVERRTPVRRLPLQTLVVAQRR
ncbi:MAG TPA: methyltransferase [Myxococcaceae bacterium]|nr:methyltransferase [Myxococcaceae bacterium]